MDAAEIDEKNLSAAEEHGSRTHQATGQNDFAFAYNKEIYRFTDGIVKRVCTAEPRLIEIVNKGSSANQRNHYLFEVHSKRLEAPARILMSPKIMVSRKAFSVALLTYVPWASFEGNTSDLGRFLSYASEEYFSRERRA
ncbi:hypothetical protein [Pseudomonas leptonychotis]|uniref:hypothetical protein n=1 Tax=Pseudomonas leptonychotis TaxID=2448482 RepID=UPI0010AA44A8|nr:hypothetical protein [Pseudomonas leptonychotis]